MKPGFGYVYVEIPQAIDSVKTASGFEFYVDTAFDPHRYANIFAKVLDVPEKLVTKSMRQNRERKAHLSSDTEIKVRPGDTVYFHYLTLKNAKKNYQGGKYFEEGGKRYALLPYSKLFFAVRKWFTFKDNQKTVKYEDRIDGEDFIMLNGWVLIEPVEINQHKESFKDYGTVIIDDERSTKNIAVIAESAFKSSEGVVKACPPEVGIEPGEIIIFEKESDVPVEYDLCKTLDKPYFRMELKDIIAKRKGRDIELLQDYCLVIQDPEVKYSSFDAWPQKPSTGEIVQISPKVKKVKEGDHVFFAPGLYTDFPFRDGRIGILVHEGQMLMETGGQKILVL